jgi:hypothetical protein
MGQVLLALLIFRFPEAVADVGHNRQLQGEHQG